MFNTFNPTPQATEAFRQTFNPIETSPLGQAGSSHFGYCNPQCANPGFHVTTQVGGFGMKEGFAPNEGLRLHDMI